MRADAPLSTGDVARYCGVSPGAVWKWVKKGRLKAYRVPGGQYRIERGAFKAFLRENDMPVDPRFFARPVKRVLIIDDEPMVVEVVARAVQQLGESIEVATAGDGFEAELQIATFKPDLLVLDLMMPQIDGFEVCRLVRRSPNTAHMKILIVTAFGIHENIERALKAGADDFMHKPLNLPSLVTKVSHLLADAA
jgi:excisionase family DNA binding protein